MSDAQGPTPGSIGWFDLTVPDASGLRDFYAAVTGWEPEGCDVGGYEDFNMKDAAGTPVAGVCHARGTNTGLPAQWLAYVVVEDIEASAARAVEHGGEVLRPPTGSGDRTCVLRDPAGAVIALYQARGESRRDG